jgi:hypothetical protein
MGVSLQEDGPTLKVGCPGERLVNVALPDGVPSQGRQLRDDRHLSASRHPGQEVVEMLGSHLSLVNCASMLAFSRDWRSQMEHHREARGTKPRAWAIG